MDAQHSNSSEKVIYIDGLNRAVFVDIYGNALRVTPKFNPQEEKLHDFLCPLRKIIRINCTGKVNWESSALIECAKRNIPIGFMQRGQIVAINTPKFSINNRISETLEALNNDLNYLRMLKNWHINIIEKFDIEIISKLSALKLPNDFEKNDNYERILIGVFENWLLSELTKKHIDAQFLGQYSFKINLFNIFSKVLRRFIIPLSYKTAIQYGKNYEKTISNIAFRQSCSMVFDTHEKFFKAKFFACWVSFVTMTYDYFEGAQNGMGHNVRYPKLKKMEKDI